MNPDKGVKCNTVPYLPSSAGSCIWFCQVQTAAKCSCLYWCFFKSVLAAVSLALINRERDTRKDWFQLKTSRQGSLLASVVLNKFVQKAVQGSARTERC